MTSSGSPLWFASRGLGMTLLLVLTATLVLGIITSGRLGNDDWPRFLTAGLHRNLSLLALALLLLHGLAVLLDPFAQMTLTAVLVPFGGAYRPLWLGLGVLSGEILLALVITSLLRHRLGFGLWRVTHWIAYLAWPLALLHGLGTGSDTAYPWALAIYALCIIAALLALLQRLGWFAGEMRGWRTVGAAAAGILTAALVAWTLAGPMQPGWARAAGTPANLLSPSPTPTPGVNQ
ncbi:MAG: ferric reductase-like transmembrane domain-containing protein [Candidatus Dormibacteria bacterium]